MKVTFVREAAGRLLSKEFCHNSTTGAIDSSNYYQHYNLFSSFEENVTDIAHLYTLMVAHASRGHAIVKGNYSTPLIDESRAGRIVKDAPTQWLCLDVDGATIPTIDALLAALGMNDVSHVVQYSASHGVKPGLRAHVFLLLNAAIGEAQLKQWLMWLNLTNPTLRASLELTKTGNSIKWPLDISLAENHRIIYIAPPKFVGMDDPYTEERIQLVERTQPTFNITAALAQADLPQVSTLKDTTRDELRAKAGLRRKRESTKHVAKYNVFVLRNPDTATVTGVKHERGFVYLNLNGGDSWGYYHPENNFEIIQNFKGEPAYLTKDLLPDYYTECVSSRRQEAANHSDLSNQEGTKYFYFTEKQSGAYLKGTWDPATETRVLDPAKSREQITDFCAQHGLEDPAFIPIMETVFDPTEAVFYDPARRRINLYQPSPYRISCTAGGAPGDVPPTIQKVLRHVTGDNAEAYEYFLNWLAYIWQYGLKPKTAWVLHGVPGTGKGTLMEQVLTPIFGVEQAREITVETLGERFNQYLRCAQVLAVDESDTDGMPNIAAVTMKLKNWITEDRLLIREMNKNPYNERNYTAFLFFSNKRNPVLIEFEDRRMNVAPRQERKLIEVMGADEFKRLPHELQAFANYLQAYDVDINNATTPLDNEAKRFIQETTTSSPEEVVRAIEKGNFTYFLDLLPSGVSETNVTSQFITAMSNYKAVLQYIYEYLQQGVSVVRLPRDDVAALFTFAVDWSMRPTKFTRTAGKFGLRFTPMRINGTTARGLEIDWTFSEDDLERYRASLQPKAMPGVAEIRARREVQETA